MHMENAIKILTMLNLDGNPSEANKLIKLLEIPENIIEAAKKQIATDEK